MTAREELRRARATIECIGVDRSGRSYHVDRPKKRGCATVDYGHNNEEPWGWHRTAASATLDGFSVRAVTEAGG
jgi:hypothetical protein